MEENYNNNVQENEQSLNMITTIIRTITTISKMTMK